MENRKLLPLSAVVLICFSLTNCNSTSQTSNKDEIILNVYNCADYICEDDDETNTKGTMRQFEEYCEEVYDTKVTINYSTFETLEDMFNQLKAGGVNYDLICPSEYMIEKLIMNDMLLKITEPMDNYDKYGSNYIHEKFDNITTHTKDGSEAIFKDYAVPYMWGTMGFMYDPNPSNNELGLDINSDVSSWDVIWNENYKNKSSLKDSIRDTYVAGVFHVYQNELELIRKLYSEGYYDTNEYNQKITEIMNRCDDDTITLVEAALKDAKDNVYEFEVDTGKEHIVKGDYWINLCWSGDAVYSLDLAEEEGKELCYQIPEEGSNVWFDGWCIPTCSKNPLWAQRLMNFLCDPAIASQNMDAVGYTSAMAGQEMWDLITDWYEADEGEETTEYDLTYFFKDTGIKDENGEEMDKFIIHTSEINRQLYAQYPNEEMIARCAVMQDFGDQYSKVSEMWIKVKGNNTSWGIIAFLAVIVGLIVFAEIKAATSKRARRRRNLTK